MTDLQKQNLDHAHELLRKAKEEQDLQEKGFTDRQASAKYASEQLVEAERKCKNAQYAVELAAQRLERAIADVYPELKGQPKSLHLTKSDCRLLEHRGFAADVYNAFGERVG